LTGEQLFRRKEKSDVTRFVCIDIYFPFSKHQFSYKLRWGCSLILVVVATVFDKSIFISLTKVFRIVKEDVGYI